MYEIRARRYVEVPGRYTEVGGRYVPRYVEVHVRTVYVVHGKYVVVQGDIQQIRGRKQRYGTRAIKSTIGSTISMTETGYSYLRHIWQGLYLLTFSTC